MHNECYEFIRTMKEKYPDYFVKKRVLELGSLNINGTVRDFFKDCNYTGIDQTPGKDVDIVSKAHEFKSDKLFDMIISAEMFEHDKYIKDSFINSRKLLKSDGIFIGTTANVNRIPHFESVGEDNYYKNVSRESLYSLARIAGFDVDVFEEDVGLTDIRFVLKPGNGLCITQGSIFEKDTVIGTFTHRDTYWPDLKKSADKFIPNVEFCLVKHKGRINAGMELLRQEFIKSGKRYWCFLDDDIQFLNPGIIHNAVYSLIKNRHACITVYSSFLKEYLNKSYDPSGLIERPISWATGYFILVDSHLVGDIRPDLSLPDGDTAVDTSYSVEIKFRGLTIGVSPDYVYHVRKDDLVGEAVADRHKVIKATNDYLMKKWGQFYFSIARYDGNVIEWGQPKGG